MQGQLTADFLNSHFSRHVDRCGDWWDCGIRVDREVGTTAVRVIPFAADGFAVEVTQGDGLDWSTGLCLPVGGEQELMAIVGSLNLRKR